MKSTLRKDVVISRHGGEEFAVILRGNKAWKPPWKIAERAANIRRKQPPVRNQGKPASKTRARLMLSLGVCIGQRADSAEELYNKADVALLYSKQAAAAQITSSTSLTETREFGKELALSYKS